MCTGRYTPGLPSNKTNVSSVRLQPVTVLPVNAQRTKAIPEILGSGQKQLPLYVGISNHTSKEDDYNITLTIGI